MQRWGARAQGEIVRQMTDRARSQHSALWSNARSAATYHPEHAIALRSQLAQHAAPSAISPDARPRPAGEARAAPDPREEEARADLMFRKFALTLATRSAINLRKSWLS